MDIIDVKFESFSTIVFEINWIVLISLFIFGAIICKVIKYIINYSRKQSINIDEIELGIGNSHITLKYDAKDKEIAYKLWIECSVVKRVDTFLNTIFRKDRITPAFPCRTPLFHLVYNY